MKRYFTRKGDWTDCLNEVFYAHIYFNYTGKCTNYYIITFY